MKTIIYNILIIEYIILFQRGNYFRKDYSRLGMLCAAFPDVPVLALTATANKADIKNIEYSLGMKTMKNCVKVVANTDRPNIYYKKYFREGKDVDAIEKLLCLLLTIY